MTTTFDRHVFQNFDFPLDNFMVTLFVLITVSLFIGREKCFKMKSTEIDRE